ncbi:hypothetical protein Lgra_2687 [Legionella gratiana]|uniref:Uncharacterized protein n=1 Tax=Legionella gratiana TaxID=45066 RepID=A0A378J421_9GAMM|nr:hypothetical protein [Legionella gratiana]KTD05910.1 hypothetical protein Lgra_2687 [Legionella gratiana]STX42385.1 Uncharacterised protein [Legionella gratiana]
MKDDPVIKDEENNYLKELYRAIKNTQERIKLERDDQQLESVHTMIEAVNSTQDKAIQKKLINTAHIQAKNFQLDLIELMINNFSELPKREEVEHPIVQGLKDTKSDEKSLFNKFLDNVEDSINAFSQTMDYFSTQFNEDALLMKRLEEAKNWLEKSEPNQEIELADFNNLINTYTIMLAKKNGNFSDVKGNDSFIDNEIHHSKERIKTLTELTSELAQLSEQYGLEVSAIRALRQEFEEKVALVKDELDLKVLSSYDSLLQQVDEVIREREREFTAQVSDSSEQILKQIEITKNAQVTLRQINEKLIDFLVNTLEPAIKPVEKNRVDYAKCSLNSLNVQLDKFKNLKKCYEDLKQDPRLQNDPRLLNYLQHYEGDITTAWTISDSIMKELSTNKLSKKQIETKKDEAEQKLSTITQSLDYQIKRINKFLKSKEQLETELNELEKELKKSPLAEIYGNDFNDLNQIRKDLQKENDIYSEISKNISAGIANLKTKLASQRQEYTERLTSNEVIQLNKLIDAIASLEMEMPNNTPDGVKNLKSGLEGIRSEYLASKITGEQFKIASAQAIVTNVTEKEVRQLTNNHENATRFGNFFRALAEFIVAIGYSITRQEKPLYRPQFFASHQEKEIAGKLYETYKLLKIKDDAENQLPSQSQRISI